MSIGWQDPHVARQQRQRMEQHWPLEPMERVRDPWLTPAIIVCAVVVVYFIVQFVR